MDDKAHRIVNEVDHAYIRPLVRDLRSRASRPWIWEETEGDHVDLCTLPDRVSRGLPGSTV